MTKVNGLAETTELESAIIRINPIGYVRSSRVDIEDDYWGNTESTIELLPEALDKDALIGLESFSHAYIIFHMHQVNPEKIVTGARHPRNNEKLPKVGIFAQRGKNRPNQLGLSCVRIKKVESSQFKLIVEELDAIDGTPVLDIKPYIQQFGPRGKVSQPDWVNDVMQNYWISS